MMSEEERYLNISKRYLKQAHRILGTTDCPFFNAFFKTFCKATTRDLNLTLDIDETKETEP